MSKRKRKEGWIVPAHEKVAMVFGAGSTQAMNTFVQSFLSVYILMVGISPAVAAGGAVGIEGLGCHQRYAVWISGGQIPV